MIVRMQHYGRGAPWPVTIEIVAPGVGRMPCPECDGDPIGYTNAFSEMRSAAAPNGCVECKNRGWVYVSA